LTFQDTFVASSFESSFADDSNKLDKYFYTELLHIIGLEEIKDKGKLKIQRKVEARRDAGL
jgi:hypothetical protein